MLPENRSIQNIFYRSEHPLCLSGEGAGGGGEVERMKS